MLDVNLFHKILNISVSALIFYVRNPDFGIYKTLLQNRHFLFAIFEQASNKSLCVSSYYLSKLDNGKY